MHKLRPIALLLLLIFTISSTGCYGPFHLTRNVHKWNGEVGDKWANEVTFLVLVWVPVYGLATLGDAIVLNSVEFWTGDNPIMLSDASTLQTRHIVQQDEEARLVYTANTHGPELLIEQFKSGEKAASLRLRQQDGMMVALNDSGEMVYSAKTLANGSVAIYDAEGNKVAEHAPEELAKVRSAQTQ